MGDAVDRWGNKITLHNGIQIKTHQFNSNTPRWLDYRPHPFEAQILDQFIKLNPLLNPLYTALDEETHNLLTLQSDENTRYNDDKTIKDKFGIYRKTFGSNLLECFPADRKEPLKIDIIDSALSNQARSIELFGRPSPIYQTGIIVPTSSDLEERLFSTNHLKRNPNLIPKSSILIVDWEKYQDSERFVELKRQHREQYRELKENGNLKWRATIDP